MYLTVNLQFKLFPPLDIAFVFFFGGGRGGRGGPNSYLAVYHNTNSLFQSSVGQKSGTVWLGFLFRLKLQYQLAMLSHLELREFFQVHSYY